MTKKLIPLDKLTVNDLWRLDVNTSAISDVNLQNMAPKVGFFYRVFTCGMSNRPSAKSLRNQLARGQLFYRTDNPSKQLFTSRNGNCWRINYDLKDWSKVSLLIGALEARFRQQGIKFEVEKRRTYQIPTGMANPNIATDFYKPSTTTANTTPIKKTVKNWLTIRFYCFDKDGKREYLKDVPYSITKKYQLHDKDVFDQGESPADGMLEYEDMPSRDFYTVHYGFPGSDKYTEQALVCSGMEHELEVREIKITAKIDAEYKVVLLDKGLSGNQEPTEEKIVTDGTRVELWLEQHPGNPVFDQGAKIEVSDPGAIDVFLDEKMTTQFNISNPISRDDVTGGKKLEVWLKGTKVGKFKLKLSPVKSSNGKFVIQSSAEMEVGVIELKMEIYEQDIDKIKSIQVDPDQELISNYHADLAAQVLPEQIALSDEDKVKKGRLLHVQENANFGRSKIVIKALTADQFPSGCDSYQFTLNNGEKNDKLKLFDTEFKGKEIKLPLKLKKSDLNADKTYWVEGAIESEKPLEAVLDMGVDRADGGMAKTPKRNGDWGRYTIVKIDTVELDYTQPAGGPNAWDAANKRFFINMQKGAAGRKIRIKAKLSKALKDINIHFMLVEDRNNRTATNWGVDLPNDPTVHQWIWKDITADVKHLDKADRKDLLHDSTKTDVSGEAVKEVKLSRFGGDKFYLAAYIEQDPHLAKYIDGHKTLGKPKPVMAKNEVNVWRKFWYQQIKIGGVNPQDVGNAPDCYKDVKVIMEKAPDKTISLDEAKALRPTAIYPKHMINYYWDSVTRVYKNNYPNDMSDGLVICPVMAHRNRFFPAPVNTTERPVTIAMVNADGLWIPDGDATFAITAWSETAFPIDLDHQRKKFINPPLQGGKLLISGEIIAEDWDPKTSAWVNHRKINLVDSDLELEPSRNSPRKLRINKPPRLVMARRTRIKIPGLRVKGAASYLGVSLKNGIVNVYTPNDPVDFVDTINHEIGHSFNQVAKVNPAGIPAHPKQYDKQGSHCDYKDKSCLMYENGPQAKALHKYCPICHPHVLVEEMSTV